MLNKTFKKSLLRLATILFAIILIFENTACGINKDNKNLQNETSPITDLSNSNANESFTEFTEALFREIVTQDYLTLHSYVSTPANFGITSYDVTLGRYDFDNLDAAEYYTELLTKLKSFDKSSLSEKQLITYEQLLLLFENELEYSDLYLYSTLINSTTGIQVQLPLILAEYTFLNEEDINNYILLLEDVDGFFSDICEYEKLRAAQGLFKADSTIDDIINQCNTFVSSAAVPESSILITSFNERLDAFEGLSEETKKSLKEKNEAAIKNHVIPGYNKLTEELNSLKGSCKYPGGLCESPDGKRYFEYLISNNLGSAKSVAEYDKLLDSTITSYLSKMNSLTMKNYSLLNSIDSFSFNMDDPHEILSDLQSKITNDFPAIPAVDYELKYVSKALSESASPAMYFIPQLDNLSLNTIYINPDCSNADIYPTLAHEGYPGHLYQTQYFASTNPDWIRYILASSGYVEGWASYVEMLSYNYADTGNEALNALMSYNYAIIMCIHAKCDIGINYYGWDKSDVNKYLGKFFNESDEAAAQIYTICVDMPGNYCKYVLGLLGFLTLRQEAENALSDAFNPKDFHKFVLDMGPVQFDILYKKLPAWIEGRKLSTQ